MAYSQLDTLNTGTGALNSGEKLKTASPKINRAIVALNSLLADTISGATLYPELADTIPLFVFGGGGGNDGDTTAITTNTLYGAFRNTGSDTLAITELRVVMEAGTTPLGTDTVSVHVSWDVNLKDATPTLLNTDPLGCNSITGGTIDASFNNAKIPPGVWVWATTPGVVTGRKPSMVIMQISGYKIPTY